MSAVTFSAISREMSAPPCSIKSFLGDRCAGVVDQHANARIFTQALLNPREILLFRQIGGHHIHVDARFAPAALGQCGHAIHIASHQDEIVASAREPVGIDPSDAGGGASDEGGRSHGNRSDTLFMTTVMYKYL